ncbi:YwqJ-related putative deaminase [Pseudovibrio sp. POLY-S9]|uniref:YwqJ-related putative deaminase n=1 Tax=Pseudovibrio sp. POLY-S9 TaxID=1576596 RepID=UPI00070E20D4|nr:YwqJ-related putative deaminase [Pseudovibrio sp. POLY-S9]
MTDAAFPDIQTEGSHLDPDVSIQGYTYDKIMEYCTAVYTLGLITELAGTTDEQKAAQAAVKNALKGVAEAATGYAEAAALALDDNTIPFLGAAYLTANRLAMGGAQSVAEFFDHDLGFKEHTSNLDRMIRDSVAVDVNQVSQASIWAKTNLESITKDTWLPDYTADTSFEQRKIAETQEIVETRQAKVEQVLDSLWKAVKEVATKRYNQFISDWAVGGLEYALGTLGVDAAFLAIETMIGVAVGLVTGGAGAVALKLVVKLGEKSAKMARVITVAIKLADAPDNRTGSFKVSENSVVEHAKKNKAFGDDLGGTPNTAHSAKHESGGPDSGKSKDGTEEEREDEDEEPKGRKKPLSEEHRKKLEDEQQKMFDETTGNPDSPHYVSKRKRSPVLTSVIDPATGEVYHGTNGGLPGDIKSKDLPSNLHPVLQKRVNNYTKALEENDTRKRFPDTNDPVNGDPGHHSEIWALNQALNARKELGMPVNESTLDELFLSNRSLEKKTFGKHKKKCPDCEEITKGADDVTGNINFRD